MEAKKTGLIIIKSIIILFVGGILGVLLMTAAFTVPDLRVDSGIDSAIAVFRNEGTEKKEVFFNFYTYGSKLMPDRDTVLSASGTGNGGMSALEKGMYINGYSRYWHGYLVFFRPMLAFFDYGQIRYIMTYIFVILIGIIMVKLQERTDKYISLLFFISLGIVNFTAVPFSLHVSMAFFVTFVVMLILLNEYRDDFSGEKRWMFYFISGMCMSFFDFLTTPITALAMPLLLELIIDGYNYYGKSIRKQFSKCIFSSVAWCLGYGFFWAEKWILGSVILKNNILSDATKEMKYWLRTGKTDNTGVLWALEKNIFCLFPSGKGVKELLPFFVIYAIVFAALIGLFIKRHQPWNRIRQMLPILFVSMYPYFWIVVMHSHSAVHATFWVYRIQICAVFGLLAFYRMGVGGKQRTNKSFKQKQKL